MDTDDVTACSICNEEFNEGETLPRNLPCSHTICSECVQNLIDRNNKQCPFCRRKFAASSVGDVGVNRSLLNAIHLLKRMQEKSSHPKPAGLDELKKDAIHLSQEFIAKFQQAEGEIDTYIQSNSVQKCNLQDILLMSNEISTLLKQLEANAKQKIRYVDEQNSILQGLKVDLIVQESRVKDCIQYLEGIKFREPRSLFDEVMDNITVGNKYLQRVGTLLPECEETRKAIAKVGISTLERMRICKDCLGAVIPDDKKMNLVPENGFSKDMLTVEALQSRNQLVMGLLKKGKIFAVQKHQDKKWYARLSMDGQNRICLHHISDEPIPSDAHLLEYNDVIRLANPPTTLAFIELSTAYNKKLGRMYIKFCSEGKRAKQFYLLCSGENGPCFTNSNILELWGLGREDESVRFGDYEDKNGKGGKALLSSVWKEIKIAYKQPQLSGAVQARHIWFGEKQASQFWIYTKDNPKTMVDNCFGKVVEGLGVLTEAICFQRNIKDVVISDTGIVLSPVNDKIPVVKRTISDYFRQQENIMIIIFAFCMGLFAIYLGY